MHLRVPFQLNDGGLVALLPDGRVTFLHPSAIRQIRAHDGDPSIQSIDFDEYVIDSPWVDLNKFHLSAPAIVFIETTNLCNLRCKHCYAFSGPKREHELTVNEINGLLDELAEIGVLQVFLTGGELFAHPSAVELITHASTKPFSTQIFTNGLLISEDTLARIPTGQSFFVSFDTAVPERTIRGGMDFPTLRKCFLNMRKYGHVFRTAISVHAKNLEDVEEIFEWCIDNDFPRPQWLETHPIGRALFNPDLLLQPSQVERVIAIYKKCMDRFHQSSDQIPQNGDLATPNTARKANPIQSVQTIKFCQQLERATGQEKCGRSVAYIRSDGEVFPCSNCMSNGMYGAGNIREFGFKQIWETGFENFRSITFKDHRVCAECPVNAADIWCQFRCPPLAHNISGDQKGCGATEYLRKFMIESDNYWKEKRRNGYRLVLNPK